MTTAMALIGVAVSTAMAHDSRPSKPFINNFTTVTQGVASAPAAGPEAGDQNLYGGAVIPRTVGKLIKGNILVSNFNNVGAPPTGNLQGTGTSIVQYARPTFRARPHRRNNSAGYPGSVGDDRASRRRASLWTRRDARWQCIYFVDDSENQLNLFH